MFCFIFNLEPVYFTKICISLFICVILHIFSETIASECYSFHMAPHIQITLCTRTVSHHGPWNSLVLYPGGTIGVQWAVDSAIGTEFYKLLSVLAKLYTPHMPLFYMPTFGNHTNNSKTVPINHYLLPPHWESPGFIGIHAIFSWINTWHVIRGYLICSTF